MTENNNPIIRKKPIKMMVVKGKNNNLQQHDPDNYY